MVSNIEIIDNKIKLDINGYIYMMDGDKMNLLFKKTDKKMISHKWILDGSKLYYNDNNKNKVYLIDLILGKKCYDNIYFVDGDCFNYCYDNLRENIIKNLDGYKIIKYHKGHIKNMGKDAGKEKNPIYEVEDKKGFKYALMKCCDKYVKISIESVDKVKIQDNKTITWYYCNNGYIASTFYNKNNKKILYLHQYLTNHYNKKDGTSVDHINRDKLDNRLENLRILNQSEQNKNQNKKKRMINAKDLPEGITNDMIPKYVIYYKECYNKDKNLYRDYFKIECHPNLKKGIKICSSKSNKISILNKLNEIKDKLNKLENNEIINEPKLLPKYIRLNKNNDALIFDKKLEDKRLTMKMKINFNDLENEIKILNDKIYKKYNINILN